MTNETQTAEIGAAPLTLTIKAYTEEAQTATVDALNETMRALAMDGCIDDGEDDGWAYDSPLLKAAPALLAALEALKAAAFEAYTVACDDHGCSDCGDSDEHGDDCTMGALYDATTDAIAAIRAARGEA